MRRPLDANTKVSIFEHLEAITFLFMACVLFAMVRFLHGANPRFDDGQRSTIFHRAAVEPVLISYVSLRETPLPPLR